MSILRREGLVPKIGAALAAGVGALLASIVVPTAAISAYAVKVRGTARIADFAMLIAEPLALLSAAAATFGIARLVMRHIRAGRRLIPWVGGGAAVSMLAGAALVFDFDWWTAAAAVILPLVALAAGRQYERERRDPLTSPDPGAGDPREFGYQRELGVPQALAPRQHKAADPIQR